MKRYLLIIVALAAAITAKAQAGYNYHEYGVGADVFIERGYTNVKTQFEHPGFDLKFMYNYSPYLPIEIEIQKGTLSGGGLTQNLDFYGRKYTNNYIAVVAHADLQLGSAIDYSDNIILGVLKNFYFGTGVGIISNSNTVQRTNVIASNGSLSYVFPGSNSAIDLMVPLRVGYEFKIFDAFDEPSFAVDIGYTHNFALGEGLDGYNDPESKFKNNAVDQYRQIYIGFKYFFGNVTSYNKLIRSF